MQQVLESMAENHVACVVGDGAFVLPPEEWPIVVILEMVGLPEQYAGSMLPGMKEKSACCH